MDRVNSLSSNESGLPLTQLLAEIGLQTAAPLGADLSDRTVHGIEFHDALEALPNSPGTLLLSPSFATASSLPHSQDPNGLRSLAERAAASSAAAVALKCRDEEAPMIAAVSREYDVPFLRLGQQIGWRLFEALVSRLLGEHNDSEDAHRNRGTEPLFALANELAGYFGGSVAIEDLGRRIIAYSSVPGQLIDRLRTQGILTRKVPDSPFNDDQYRTVLRSEVPIKYPRLDDEEPRVAFAIRAGTLPLGTIWALDASGEEVLTDTQSERIVAAATIAAAHMLDDIRVRRATQLPREGKLHTLLDGHEVTGSELAELGLSEVASSPLA